MLERLLLLMQERLLPLIQERLSWQSFTWERLALQTLARKGSLFLRRKGSFLNAERLLILR